MYYDIPRLRRICGVAPFELFRIQFRNPKKWENNTFPDMNADYFFTNTGLAKTKNLESQNLLVVALIQTGECDIIRLPDAQQAYLVRPEPAQNKKYQYYISKENKAYWDDYGKCPWLPDPLLD